MFPEKDLPDCHPGVPADAMESGLASNSISPRSHPRKSPLALYIGHWHSKTQAAARSPITDDRPPLEEQALEGLLSTTSGPSPQPGLTTNNMTSDSGYALAEQIGVVTTLDYYQLHWFWVVVSTIFGGAILSVLTVLLKFRYSIHAGPVAIAIFVVYFFAPFIICTGGFLMLSRFHASLGRKVEKTLKIRRERQRTLMRLLPWCWFAASMVYMIQQTWLSIRI